MTFVEWKMQKEMKKIFLVLISIFILILTTNIVSADDVLVWQGQYYTGTTFSEQPYAKSIGHPLTAKRDRTA